MNEERLRTLNNLLRRSVLKFGILSSFIVLVFGVHEGDWLTSIAMCANIALLTTLYAREAEEWTFQGVIRDIRGKGDA